MRQISYDQAILQVYRYTDKLADDFSTVLPFERDQALIVKVGPDDNGDRKVSIDVVETLFIMKKINYCPMCGRELSDD